MISYIVPTNGESRKKSRRFDSIKYLRNKKLDGAPGTTRTCGLLIRSQTLYPTELRAHPFGLNKLQHRTEFRNQQFCAKNCARKQPFDGALVRG